MSDYVYKRIDPSPQLSPFIYCYWGMQMKAASAKKYVVLPDGYFDILIYKRRGQVQNQADLIGLSTKARSYQVKPDSLSFAISFKLPAAEFLLNKKIETLLNSSEAYNTAWTTTVFQSIEDFNRWTIEVEQQLLPLIKEIPNQKSALFSAVYKSAGDIAVKDLSALSHQSTRQLNRYFRNWFGLPLKEYLAILRYRNAFERLHQQQLSPDLPFYDQSHFIREVKRFSGVTPGELAVNENDRFVQFSTLNEK